jgi:fumarate hydratase class II
LRTLLIVLLEYRTETDSLGEANVPTDKLWGARFNAPQSLGWDFNFVERVFFDPSIYIIQSVVLSQ